MPNYTPLTQQHKLIHVASLGLDALIAQGTSLTEAQYAAALDAAAQSISCERHPSSPYPHVIQSIIEAFSQGESP